jgi:cysteine desulfurase/selenocysteine lyase
MKHLGLDGTARASFAVYNTIQEIDTFAEALRKLAHKFAKV